jgi:hypothetical protein
MSACRKSRPPHRSRWQGLSSKAIFVHLLAKNGNLNYIFLIHWILEAVARRSGVPKGERDRDFETLCTQPETASGFFYLNRP